MGGLSYHIGVTPIATAAQMRAIEAEADRRGHAYAAMMDLAGRAVARVECDEPVRAGATGAEVEESQLKILAQRGLALRRLTLANLGEKLDIWSID